MARIQTRLQLLAFPKKYSICRRSSALKLLLEGLGVAVDMDMAVALALVDTESVAQLVVGVAAEVETEDMVEAWAGINHGWIANK